MRSHSLQTAVGSVNRHWSGPQPDVYRTGPTMGLPVTASAGRPRAKTLSHSSPVRPPSPSEALEGAGVPTERHLHHF